MYMYMYIYIYTCIHIHIIFLRTVDIHVDLHRQQQPYRLHRSGGLATSAGQPSDVHHFPAPKNGSIKCQDASFNSY